MIIYAEPPPPAPKPEPEHKPSPPPKDEYKPEPPKPEYKDYTFGEEITLKCEHGKIVVKGKAY